MGPSPAPGSDAEVARLGWFSLREVSDVVVLALPPIAGTRHLPGAGALAAMRPGAFWSASTAGRWWARSA
ncbi:MAG: hypothetical protein ACLP5E_26780 [Streptosporangiaceae bacterium]